MSFSVADHVEIRLSEFTGRIFGYFVVRGDLFLLIGLVLRVVSVGEEEVEFYLGVVDGLGGYYFAEVVPFTHDLFVLRYVRRYCLLKESPESLYQLALPHDNNISLNTRLDQSSQYIKHH